MFNLLDDNELKTDKNIKILESLKICKKHISIEDIKATKDGKIVFPQPFAITNIQDTPGEVSISPNTPKIRTRICAYTAPTGYIMVFDSESIYNYLFFIPHTSKNEFIIGDVELMLEYSPPTKTPKKIFHANTKTINTHPSKRRFNNNVVAIGGDIIILYFTSDKVLCPEKTDLEIHLRADKIIS